MESYTFSQSLDTTKKSLEKPKAERILEFFEDIHLSTVEIGDQIYHTITGLSAKHLEILALMDIGIGAFETLGAIQQSEL
jgi:hypothetical protein